MSEPLAQYALNLQRALFPPFLAAAGVLFFLGAFSLSLLRIGSRPEPGLPPLPKPQISKWGPQHLRATYILLWLATAFTLVIAYSTTLTLTSLQFAPTAESQAAIQVSRGTSVEVLQWFLFSLSTLFSVGVVRIIRTYKPAGAAAPGGPGGNPPPPPPPPGPPPR
jgi:hypothetical protein